MRQPAWLLPLHLVMILLGAWRIAAGVGASRIVGGILIALGVLGVLAFVKGRLGQDVRRQRLAQRARKLNRPGEPHAYRPAGEADWAEVDWAWYERLALGGFTRVGDVVDETLQRRGRMVLLRCLADGRATAATGLHLPKTLTEAEARVVTLETLLEGEAMLLVVTDNTQGVDLAPDPPGVSRRRLMPDASPGELANAHAEAVAAARAAHAELKPRVVVTLDDVLAVQRAALALRE
jgi:hypothetical protein